MRYADLSLGDKVQITEYTTETMCGWKDKHKELVGQIGLVVAINAYTKYSYPEICITVRLSSGKEYQFRTYEHWCKTNITLVEKGRGWVTPGIDYLFTEEELQSFRYTEFLYKLTQIDQRYNGFSNAATYLAWLYLNQEPKFHKNLQYLYRKDGTINPNKITKWFYALKLKIDAWALDVQCDIPAEFIKHNRPKPGVYWSEVADNFKRE